MPTNRDIIARNEKERKKRKKKKKNKKYAKERDRTFVKLLQDQQILHLADCDDRVALQLIKTYKKEYLNYPLVDDIEEIWENQSLDKDVRYRLVIIRIFNPDLFQAQRREFLQGNIPESSIGLNEKSRYIINSLIISALELPYRIWPYWKNINEMTLPANFDHWSQKFSEGCDEHFFRGAGSITDKPLQHHILQTAEELGAKPLPKPKKEVKKNEIPKECSYLNKPLTVEASAAHFESIRKKATLGKGRDGKHLFKGDEKVSDAIIHDVTIGTKKVRVIMPKVLPKGKYLPSASDIANALGTVPIKQLSNISRVVVNPKPNPDDAYWAEQYGISNFSSAATGGNNGVTFYPKSTSWSQPFTDSTMIHEGGHAYSSNLWKNEKHKSDWTSAIKKDAVAPSVYAESSETEDFSESLVMHSLSKGTKCEKFAKKIYPARYKLLDILLK